MQYVFSVLVPPSGLPWVCVDLPWLQNKSCNSQMIQIHRDRDKLIHLVYYCSRDTLSEIKKASVFSQLLAHFPNFSHIFLYFLILSFCLAFSYFLNLLQTFSYFLTYFILSQVLAHFLILAYILAYFLVVSEYLAHFINFQYICFNLFKHEP